jgi:hypothetical protein
MKKTFIAIMATLGLFMSTACGNKADNTVDEVASLSVDSILATPDNFVGDTITIEGVVSHLCKHGGKKAFLLGSDENTMIRCEATPDMGGYFPQETIHKPLRVTGVLVESRIYEETVQQMEAQHAEQVRMIAEEAGEEQAAAVDQAVSGCETERKAQGQGEIDSFRAQMADYRARIAERTQKENKPYLSGYYLVALSYEILPE